MPIPTIAELKKELLAGGFELYRTLGSRILIADRVRENLIMDSGVAVVVSDALSVRFVVRAQTGDFPGEGEEELFQRARRVADKGLLRGYAEVETAVVPIPDPGDRTRTLDTWYEVAFEKRVDDVAQAIDELRWALGLNKAAVAGKRA
jgi:hypothetical protein